MIFTASDVPSLARSLSRWEYAEYVSCALVAIGCAGEYIAEFTNWLTAGIKERKDRLAKRSTLLLVASLALELVCLVRTNVISGQLIGSLTDKANAADAKADSATRKLGTLDKEVTAAKDQLSTVTKRADGLTKQLGSAEGRITEAEARADQLSKDILEVEAELSDRVFDNQEEAGGRLSKFAPVSAIIEYLPDAECGDCESVAGQISAALLTFANWKVLAVRPNPDKTIFFDEVIVQVHAFDAVGDTWKDAERAERAAEALVSELNKTHIQARTHAPDLHFPPGVVVIRIGKKPNPVVQRMIRDWMKKRDENLKRLMPPTTH